MDDKSTSSGFRLSRPNMPLPTARDFDPLGCDLDAQSAWKHFGRLTIQAAYDLFLSNPVYYEEDFMFMGSKAFEYYLPVIDRYLREISYEDEMDDCEAAILGSGVVAQFQSSLSEQTVKEIEELCSFVRANLHRYAESEGEQKRIDSKWEKVALNIVAYRTNRISKNGQ